MKLELTVEENCWIAVYAAYIAGGRSMTAICMPLTQSAADIADRAVEQLRERYEDEPKR